MTPSPSQKRAKPFKVLYGDGNGHLEKEKIVKAWFCIWPDQGVQVLMKRPKMSSMHALKVRVVPCEIVLTLPKRKV